MTNEAADRLREALAAQERRWLLKLLDAALAAERRATVERIRAEVDKVEEWNADQTASYVMTGDLWAILDAEAAR